MPKPKVSLSKSEEVGPLDLLVEIFRQAGGRIVRQKSPGPDLVIEYGGKKYLIELKRSSELRRDRLVPLLSQAVLQAQAMARLSSAPVVPMAIVSAPRISDSGVEEIRHFAQNYIPDVAVGIIDGEGLRVFIGDGLDALNAKRQVSRKSQALVPSPSVDLFSDLNQWMLKVLLSSRIPESLLSAPRGEYRNSSQLAAAAGVSVMSSFRLVRQLQKEGFIDESEGFLRIVRSGELMQRWLSHSLRAANDVPARWIIRGGESQLKEAVKSYMKRMALSPKRQVQSSHPSKKARICLGLFSAADALGAGFVRGVPPYLYVESLDSNVLRQLGLSLENAKHQADVFLRAPNNREAVFRAAVLKDGLAISDIVQVWLDVSSHPSRGKEQADQIQRRFLKQLFE